MNEGIGTTCSPHLDGTATSATIANVQSCPLTKARASGLFAFQENVMPSDEQQAPQQQSEATTAPTLEEREKAFAEAEPDLYAHIRGPITQDGERYGDCVERMAEEAGLGSAFNAVHVAIAAKAAKADYTADQSPHPAHALLDEIHSNLQVQYNPTWLRKKLDELRKAL